MIDSGEIIGFALDDFGTEAVINGVSTDKITVIPCLDGDSSLQGEMIDRVGPFALASAAAVSSAALVYGNDGDTLTINSIDYTVLAIDPDGQGGVVLSLVEEA